MIREDIESLENFIGFPIRRNDVSLESGKPFDETFSYGLCQRFHGKKDELRVAISKSNELLVKLLKPDQDSKQIESLYSLIGNMYYMLGNFETSAGYFLKALGYNKESINNWMDLLFSLRSLGRFDLFEKLLFNLEDVYLLWKTDPDENMTQEKIMEIVREVNRR